MLEITELKAKKLPELQGIAKSLGVPKIRSYRKLDLIYQILDYQAANPKKAKAALQGKAEKDKPQEKTKSGKAKGPSPKKIESLNLNRMREVLKSQKISR